MPPIAKTFEIRCALSLGRIIMIISGNSTAIFVFFFPCAPISQLDHWWVVSTKVPNKDLALHTCIKPNCPYYNRVTSISISVSAATANSTQLSIKATNYQLSILPYPVYTNSWPFCTPNPTHCRVIRRRDINCNTYPRISSLRLSFF